MAIRYDGVEFSSVSELIEYKQWEQSKAIMPQVHEPEQEQPLYEHKKKPYKVWSKEETTALKGMLAERKSLKYMTRALKRTKSSVYNKALADFRKLAEYLLVKKSNGVKVVGSKMNGSKIRMKAIHARAKEIMASSGKRFKEAYKMAIAEDGERRKPQTISLPDKIGLTETSMTTFVGLLKEVEAKARSKIDIFTAEYTLQRADGMAWNAKNWEEFVELVINNAFEIESKHGCKVFINQSNNNPIMERG
jgi:hypothetical protein